MKNCRIHINFLQPVQIRRFVSFKMNYGEIFRRIRPTRSILLFQPLHERAKKGRSHAAIVFDNFANLDNADRTAPINYRCASENPRDRSAVVRRRPFCVILTFARAPANASLFSFEPFKIWHIRTKVNKSIRYIKFTIGSTQSTRAIVNTIAQRARP